MPAGVRHQRSTCHASLYQRNCQMDAPEPQHTAHNPPGFWRDLRQRFHLNSDKADDRQIDDNIRAGVSLSGSNLWALICAILLASVGLNVNSASAIIGAMLISPLMGPIVGAGYGIAIYDFALVRKSLKISPLLRWSACWHPACISLSARWAKRNLNYSPHQPDSVGCADRTGRGGRCDRCHAQR
jgi:hypothetical protein